MLSIPLNELAEHSEEIAAEVRAGHSLELIQGGKRIADVIPTAPQPTDDEVRAAWKDMLGIMHEGLELGGTPFTRDEMHER